METSVSMKFLSNLLYKVHSQNSKEIDVYGCHNISLFRKYQNDSLKSIISNLPLNAAILNIGAVQEDPDKEGSHYNEYFKEHRYYTLDKNRTGCINHFCKDLHDLTDINDKFDLILLMSVLEHVKNPFIAIKEIKKILNFGGYVFVSVPFFYPIHKSVEKGYSDYWRFSDDALRVLFADFDEVWIKEVPSVIRKIEDRSLYWINQNTVSGYTAFFKLNK
jgi:SAM-dependent methyltransferase